MGCGVLCRRQASDVGISRQDRAAVGLKEEKADHESEGAQKQGLLGQLQRKLQAHRLRGRGSETDYLGPQKGNLPENHSK